MTPAPDTGRTAEEMRETIARFWWDRVCPTSHVGRWDEAKGLAGFRHLVAETYEDADAILRSPLAKAADEGWRQAALNQDAELVDYRRAETAEAEAAHLRAENANLRDRVREAEKGAEAMQGDPGRAAYEARFAHARPRDVEPWDSLPPEVKAIWARVEAACRAPASLSAQEG